MSTRHIAVLVVVGVALRRVDLFRESGPLEPVAGTLAETGITARLLDILRVGQTQRVAGRAGDVAVAAADLHGIGREDAPGRARTVRKGHDLTVSRSERETSQIDPCAAAHRLVDGERGLPAEVVHRIMRIVGAFGRRFVTYIDRIFAPFGDVGPPHGAGRTIARHGARAARRAVTERVFTRMVNLSQVCETRTAGFPGPFFRILPGVVVVGQHLEFLHVAFARQHHAGPGIFEHRDQIRQHVTLRIEVLAGLPKHRTLPFPTVLSLVEIASVALPKGDMTPRKPLRRSRGSRKARHERPLGAVGERHDLPLCNLLLQLCSVAAGQRHQFADFALVRVKFDAGFAELLRQQGTHRVAQGLHVVLAEGIVGQPHRRVNLHPAARSLHGLNPHIGRLGFLITARDLAGDDARQRPGNLGTGSRSDLGSSYAT